jgi:hypothetical protein
MLILHSCTQKACRFFGFVVMVILNPLDAMVAIWHHITVSFKVLAQKGFIGTWIFWMNCISERFTVAKSVF